MASPSLTPALNTGTTQVGILFNPLGGQVRKRTATIRQVLTTVPHVIFQEASNANEFQIALDNLLQAKINLLVIVGGDGSVHAVLDLLLSKYSPEKIPVLAVIAGGTTNMTSIDLGIRGNVEHAIKRLTDFLRQPQPLAPFLVRKPILCLQQPGVNNIYGLFFGAGLVARGVKFSRSSVKQWGITGGLFTSFIMLRSLAGMILGKRQKEWAPTKIAVTEPNGKVCTGIYLFALVSALDCLLLGIRPYWGKESAPLHVTMVDQQCKHLWRSLWPLLAGRGHNLKQQDGYHSLNVNSIELIMDDEFIIDGELYRANSQNGPLRISATNPVAFLVI